MDERLSRLLKWKSRLPSVHISLTASANGFARPVEDKHYSSDPSQPSLTKHNTNTNTYSSNEATAPTPPLIPSLAVPSLQTAQLSSSGALKSPRSANSKTSAAHSTHSKHHSTPTKTAPKSARAAHSSTLLDYHEHDEQNGSQTHRNISKGHQRSPTHDDQRPLEHTSSRGRDTVSSATPPPVKTSTASHRFSTASPSSSPPFSGISSSPPNATPEQQQQQLPPASAKASNKSHVKHTRSGSGTIAPKSIWSPDSPHQMSPRGNVSVAQSLLSDRTAAAVSKRSLQQRRRVLEISEEEKALRLPVSKEEAIQRMKEEMEMWNTSHTPTKVDVQGTSGSSRSQTPSPPPVTSLRVNSPNYLAPSRTVSHVESSCGYLSDSSALTRTTSGTNSHNRRSVIAKSKRSNSSKSVSTPTSPHRAAHTSSASASASTKLTAAHLNSSPALLLTFADDEADEEESAEATSHRSRSLSKSPSRHSHSAHVTSLTLSSSSPTRQSKTKRMGSKYESQPNAPPRARVANGNRLPSSKEEAMRILREGFPSEEPTAAVGVHVESDSEAPEHGDLEGGVVPAVFLSHPTPPRLQLLPPEPSIPTVKLPASKEESAKALRDEMKAMKWQTSSTAIPVPVPVTSTETNNPLKLFASDSSLMSMGSEDDTFQLHEDVASEPIRPHVTPLPDQLVERLDKLPASKEESRRMMLALMGSSLQDMPSFTSGFVIEDEGEEEEEEEEGDTEENLGQPESVSSSTQPQADIDTSALEEPAGHASQFFRETSLHVNSGRASRGSLMPYINDLAQLRARLARTKHEITS